MAKKKLPMVTVSERALMGRIQRKLKASGQKLVKSRPNTQTYLEFGSYYITDQFTVVCTHQELEKLGRELAVLKPYEKLED